MKNSQPYYCLQFLSGKEPMRYTFLKTNSSTGKSARQLNDDRV